MEMNFSNILAAKICYVSSLSGVIMVQP